MNPSHEFESRTHREASGTLNGLGPERIAGGFQARTSYPAPQRKIMTGREFPKIPRLRLIPRRVPRRLLAIIHNSRRWTSDVLGH
jgi:hypothetical protein